MGYSPQFPRAPMRLHAECALIGDRWKRQAARRTATRRGQGFGSETIRCRRHPYSCSLKPTESQQCLPVPNYS